MENKIDYSKLEKIKVKTQEELDLIPLDFRGSIIIDGEKNNWIAIKNRYYKSVIISKNSSVKAYGSSYVEAHENSSVRAYGSSYVVAHENSSVEAYRNSSVEAHENSSVEAYDNSSVRAHENSYVVAWENSYVRAYENSSVGAFGNSSVGAFGNSSVEAYENSYVEAYENSYVEAGGNSYVEAYDNSSVRAYGNVQVVDYQQGAKIQISGNARIVYNPKTIHEFMDFFGIKHDKKKAVFYKAVHYDDGNYFSDYDSTFIYVIGDVVKEECDPDVEEDCSNGIHISTQRWALGFGEDWKDLAILELETDIDKIVLPKNSDGKVRTSEAKVLREVPLEECGLYGKILAKRKGRI